MMSIKIRDKSRWTEAELTVILESDDFDDNLLDECASDAEDIEIEMNRLKLIISYKNYLRM